MQEKNVDEDISEDSIVHQAVGILRRRISQTKEMNKKEYYSVDEISLQSLKDYVDPLLYKAIGWLTK